MTDEALDRGIAALSPKVVERAVIRIAARIVGERTTPEKVESSTPGAARAAASR